MKVIKTTINSLVIYQRINKANRLMIILQNQQKQRDFYLNT